MEDTNQKITEKYSHNSSSFPKEQPGTSTQPASVKLVPEQSAANTTKFFVKDEMLLQRNREIFQSTSGDFNAVHVNIPESLQDDSQQDSIKHQDNQTEGIGIIKSSIIRPINEFDEDLPTRSAANKNETTESSRRQPEQQTVRIYVTNEPPPPYNDRENYVYRDGRYYPRNERNDRNPNRQARNDSSAEYIITFDDKRIRDQFVRKVYTILTVQLFITFGFIALCMFIEDLREFMIRNALVLLIVSMIFYLILSIALFCFDSARKTFPLNFILLLLFTITMTILTATFSCFYSTYVVLLAFGTTAVICTTISFLACTPCIDITGCGAFLFIAFVIIALYGLIAMILSIFLNMAIFFLIYAALMTLLMAFYLLYDTQLVLGGKRYEISAEEYILGALTLYTDIIIMFFYILVLCGYKS